MYGRVGINVLSTSSLRQTWLGRGGVEGETNNKMLILGQEPWSSGYGRRLMFRRLWVRIPAQ